LDKGFLDQLSLGREDYKSGHYATTKNLEDASLFFVFSAINTDVEWGMGGYMKNGTTDYLLYTSHSNQGVIRTDGCFNLNDMFVNFHSHPRKNGLNKASGYDKYVIENGKIRSSGDIIIANEIYCNYKTNHPSSPLGDYPKLYIFNAKTNDLFRYDPSHSYIKP